MKDWYVICKRVQRCLRHKSSLWKWPRLSRPTAGTASHTHILWVTQGTRCLRTRITPQFSGHKTISHTKQTGRAPLANFGKQNPNNRQLMHTLLPLQFITLFLPPTELLIVVLPSKILYNSTIW